MTSRVMGVLAWFCSDKLNKRHSIINNSIIMQTVSMHLIISIISILFIINAHRSICSSSSTLHQRVLLSGAQPP